MDIDIVKIDESIRKYLNNHVDQLALTAGNFHHSRATPWLNNILQSIAYNNKLVRDQQYDYEFYILETGSLIEEYLNLLKIPVKIVFGARPQTPRITISQIIMYKYVLSRLYLSTDPPRRFDHSLAPATSKSSTFCATCGAIMDDIICPACSAPAVDSTAYAISYSDAKYPIQPRTCSEKRNHFVNCFNQYQGQVKGILDPQIILRVEQELLKYGVVDVDKPARVDKYARVTKEHIKLILKDLSLFKANNDNLTYIYYTITDRRQSIAHLKEIVLRDFDRFNDAYTKHYPNTDKKSFNYQQLLFQFLSRHGHKCNPDDFNFLKTTDRKIQHDQIYKKIFQELGWNYVSFF